MSEKMTSQRLLAHETGISLKAISNSVLTLQEKMELRKTRADLFDSNLYLAAANPMSMSDIRGKAIKLQSNTKIDLIVVDYLQMIATAGQNRTQEIGAVSRGLKALARELDCPVIALSSLNRAADKRDDKRPMMADLRESGDIESDADVIMFLYRASYYATAGTREAIETDECEVIVSKNRNGPVGSVVLEYTPNTGRFKDMEFSLL
jgi:replicative DNA helicase